MSATGANKSEAEIRRRCLSSVDFCWPSSVRDLLTEPVGDTERDRRSIDNPRTEEGGCHKNTPLKFVVWVKLCVTINAHFLMRNSLSENEGTH